MPSPSTSLPFNLDDDRLPVTISSSVVDRLRHDTQAALSVIVHSTLVDSGSQLGPERRPLFRDGVPIATTLEASPSSTLAGNSCLLLVLCPSSLGLVREERPGRISSKLSSVYRPCVMYPISQLFLEALPAEVSGVSDAF
ncbi:hypothetical protein E4U14_008122 [Claviceps sp. LM454 group G7]|nr:hypothetical protein E4U14_008122 [Claviceps sp. LM454 group G7]